MKSTQYGCTIAAAVAGIFAMTMSATGYALDSEGLAAKIQAAQFQPTAEQKAEAVARMDLAKRIIANLATEATQLGLAPEWKQATMNILLRNSASKLTQIARIGGYQATIDAATTGKGLVMPKDIGSTTTDLVFVPWTPCRFVDTRVVGGKISGTRGYDLSLNGASYGGVAGCAPTTLAGVGENSFGAMAMNITITDTSTAGVPGFAAARPTGSTALTSLVNWYLAGSTVTDANAAIVQMDQSLAGDEFEIVTSGPVHVIIDLFGAFTSPSATPLDCVLTAATTANLDTVTRNYNAFSPSCAATYTAVSSKCEASGDFFNLQQGGGGVSGASAHCYGRYVGGGTVSVSSYALCCRIPGH